MGGHAAAHSDAEASPSSWLNTARCHIPDGMVRKRILPTEMEKGANPEMTLITAK
jgi:hypothetical protein